MMAELADLVDPARWQVYDGKQPAGVSREDVPLFVSFYPGPSEVIGEGLASECWGQVRKTWIVQCFGTTTDEAENLRSWLLARSWSSTFELLPFSLSPTTPMETADPALWMNTFTVRDIEAWGP